MSGVDALRVSLSKSVVKPDIAAPPLSIPVAIVGLICKKVALAPARLINGASSEIEAASRVAILVLKADKV